MMDEECWVVRPDANISLLLLSYISLVKVVYIGSLRHGSW
jgi:hypothetical protein